MDGAAIFFGEILPDLVDQAERRRREVPEPCTPVFWRTTRPGTMARHHSDGQSDDVLEWEAEYFADIVTLSPGQFDRIVNPQARLI